jgi:hypothetical protein
MIHSRRIKGTSASIGGFPAPVQRFAHAQENHHALFQPLMTPILLGHRSACKNVSQDREPVVFEEPTWGTQGLVGRKPKERKKGSGQPDPFFPPFFRRQ